VNQESKENNHPYSSLTRTLDLLLHGGLGSGRKGDEQFHRFFWRIWRCERGNGEFHEREMLAGNRRSSKIASPPFLFLALGLEKHIDGIFKVKLLKELSQF
jgi:hypothetical protein